MAQRRHERSWSSSCDAGPCRSVACRVPPIGKGQRKAWCRRKLAARRVFRQGKQKLNLPALAAVSETGGVLVESGCASSVSADSQVDRQTLAVSSKSACLPRVNAQWQGLVYGRCRRSSLCKSLRTMRNEPGLVRSGRKKASIRRKMNPTAIRVSAPHRLQPLTTLPIPLGLRRHFPHSRKPLDLSMLFHQVSARLTGCFTRALSIKIGTRIICELYLLF